MGIPQTPLDANLEMLLARSEVFKSTIDELIGCCEMMIEPDALTRGTSKILTFVDTGIRPPQHKTGYSAMSASMLSNSQKVPSNSSFWQSLISAGNSFKESSDAEAELNSLIREKFLVPLQLLRNNEYREVIKLKDELNGVRMELDSLKEKLRKAPDDPATASRSRKVTSDFQLVCVKLQTVLEAFCGADGQEKLSSLIFTLLDTCKEYHARTAQLFSRVKKP
ncbi:Endophilin-A3 [Thelohanellus kitauei]|uniref:Endophilin-A3 n=1 Tax=Thelohanellus kitauei TaxID=669202 RepID=A0A0C2NJ46_THEKT|nr:Endophilin-A3 [Thelohanellus kitauei]